MINKINTYYVDYPTAKILKKFGFNVPCELFYEWYPHYQDEPLSFDDECELKAEGKAKEITYKELIQKMYNTNSSLGSKKNCSCPSLEVVRSWIHINLNIVFVIKPYFENQLLWKSEIYSIKEKTVDLVKTLNGKDNDTQALADSIEYSLKLIKKYLKDNERKD